jgi:Ca2+-transporting ATPase
MGSKEWYQLNEEEILHLQNVNAIHGLCEQEVKSRQSKGLNEFSKQKKTSKASLFFHQFHDFMVLVLLGATLISALLGEYLDAITIVAIIFMNSVLGFIQEFKAEKSLTALKNWSAPTAKVLREQKWSKIPAKEIVVGDVIQIESGDRVPADVRFIEVNHCCIEESALTGESIPVMKQIDPITNQDVPVAEQKNMGFLGTMVVKGTAKAIVVRTGMDTEIGKIAHLLQTTETVMTPLQKRLEQLGKILILIALVMTLLVVGTGILHGQSPYVMFLSGVSLAVAAIPEGLPAMVTIALALGVQRLIKRKAIIRKLPSVETLGCASVICSDKTGTLTQNKMCVTHLWVNGDTFEVTGNGYEPYGEIKKNQITATITQHLSLQKLIEAAAYCNNASLHKLNSSSENVLEQTHEHHSIQPLRDEIKPNSREISNHEISVKWSIQGDPTEGALIVLATKAGLFSDEKNKTVKREQEFPFDAERKRMSVSVQQASNRYIYTKGAPDLLIELCTYILWGNQVIPFTATLKQKVIAANEQFAQAARRVLGFCYRELSAHESCEHLELAERKLIFVGLAGLIDPPRPEVADAIHTCQQAGIKTVMITGDHQITAEAIAQQLGMVRKVGHAINGQQLQEMTDDELDKRIQEVSVFARVTPEHKLRIVKSFQRLGHVVAMTGDGVNDAPAVKAADIGIAMGISGTDVTKEAADLVLRDDNFATIVSSVEEGRNIYENIRKFIRYLLASNVGEIMTMLFAMMLGLPLPLVPIQILWVNLVTDGLPAMALSVDPAEKNLMKQGPRSAKENVFARRLGWKILSRGILIGFFTLIAFWLTYQVDPEEPIQLMKAQTVAFATLVLAQLIHVFDCRSSRSIFHRNPLQNKALVFAVISSLGLLAMVIYMESLQPIFKTLPLAWEEWILILIFASIPSFLLGIGSMWSKTKQNKTKIR